MASEICRTGQLDKIMILANGMDLRKCVKGLIKN